MVPVVELRGAIPTGFFGYDLPIVQVCIISAIANLIPVPIIYFFARKVLVWGKDKKVIGKFFTFCLEKGEKGGQGTMNVNSWSPDSRKFAFVTYVFED